MIGTRLLVRTLLLATCAAGLVFVVRRPDLHFSMNLVEQAINENVKGVLLVVPAIIAYYATMEFASSPKDQVERWPVVALRYFRYLSIIVIGAALLSLWGDYPRCDEFSDDCSEPLSPERGLMNFLRVTMAAVVGMALALYRQQKSDRFI